MDDYALVVNVDAAVVRGDNYLVIQRSAEEVADAFWLSYGELLSHEKVPACVEAYTEAVGASR